VPLLALVGAIRRRRPLPACPKRIGIFSPTAIGDLILESGVITHIHETFPEASIYLFHGASNASAVPLLTTSVHAQECNFSDFAATLRAIRAAKLDIVADLTPWPRLTALYAALSGAMTVGFDSEFQRRHCAYDIAVPHLRTRHEAENLQALAGVFSNCSAYRISVRNDLPIPSRPLPYSRLVLFHVSPGGSRATDKSWPTDRWAQLLRLLAADGFSIALTGTPADSHQVESVLRLAALPTDVALSLCGQLSLTELGGTLKASRLLVTVDTGVLHLASALNVPVIALHGPTRSTRWGARSSASVSIDAVHPDAGYIHLGFERKAGGSAVMRSHSVDKVYAEIRSILSSGNYPRYGSTFRENL